MTLGHRIDGDGDRVVLLAGSLGSTLDMWEPQLPALAPAFRVLRYDHPGHGGSPLPDDPSIAAFARNVVSLLDDLDIERVSFVGLSLGGAVAMQLALDAPERVDRLVLCATAARFATAEFWDERAATVRSGGVEVIADGVLERWLTPGFRDRTRYREVLISTSREGYARCCEALREWDLRGRLGAVRASTLTIAGADDPTAPPSELEAIAREIPGTRLEVVERARHLVSAERPDEVNRALLAHLDR